MNWFEVWTHVAAAIEEDEEIGVVLGRGEGMAFYLAGARAFQVPSMTALLVVDTEEEVSAPAEWQFDICTKTLDDAVVVEKALRRLFNQPLATQLGNAVFTAEFLAGQALRGPEENPFFRRVLEFRFTPVRSRYHRPQPVGE